jgi:hypothetical protein
MNSDPEKLARDEAAVLDNMNRALESMRQPPLDRVTQIYSDTDATFLTTFKELDHFPWREGATYFGPWTLATGKPPEWPQGRGPRIFAYLKDCPALPHVLKFLADFPHPTIACVDTADPRPLPQVKGPAIRVERDRLDMSRVARECDLGICHAPHGTTAAMLLAGKPLMLLPIFLEQGLMAHNVCRLGAAVQAPAVKPDLALAELQRFVASFETYAPAARDFATKYDDYDPEESNHLLLDQIEALLTPVRRPFAVAQK